uniref:C3H1-type domain-containing protein n=1 Tax=Aplanochytrium stocchinoi TaxID=215587 RepID=A0A7S3LM83_9STRA|mmetsp:Transcript_13169/g.15201  ORF Transcript_13169/g.15201 Transcript_13169/m.15201 type:complete len:145 (-) Transcript_13169:539-973(-)
MTEIKSTNDPEKEKSVPVCSHFLKGKCTRGNNCRFSHASASVSDVQIPKKLKRKRPGAQWRSRQAEKNPNNTEDVVPIDMTKAPPPLCKGHKEPCVQRKVLKEGPNKNREYFLCPRSGRAGRKRCGFFQWCERKGKNKKLKTIL